MNCLQLNAWYCIIVHLLGHSDVKLYVKVIGPVDESELQNALSALVSWANSWQLSLSIDKCCVLNIGKQVVLSQFYIQDLPLPTVCS